MSIPHNVLGKTQSSLFSLSVNSTSPVYFIQYVRWKPILQQSQ